MEFKHHIGKGIWAFADKALPAIWGVANIFLVQRVLSNVEYSSLAVILQVFYLVTTLCTAFAFQPLVKYAAELEDPQSEVAASLVLSVLYYAATIGILLLFKVRIMGMLDK